MDEAPDQLPRLKRLACGVWAARIRFGQDRAKRINLPGSLRIAEAKARLETICRLADCLHQMRTPEALEFISRAVCAVENAEIDGWISELKSQAAERVTAELQAAREETLEIDRLVARLRLPGEKRNATICRALRAMPHPAAAVAELATVNAEIEGSWQKMADAFRTQPGRGTTLNTKADNSVPRVVLQPIRNELTPEQAAKALAKQQLIAEIMAMKEKSP